MNALWSIHTSNLYVESFFNLIAKHKTKGNNMENNMSEYYSRKQP